MIKTGASTRDFFAWMTGQMRMTEVDEDGVFADIAFRTLHSHLSNQEEKISFDGFFSIYNGYQAPWAIWAFAVAKGEESARKWRLDLDASRQTPRTND